MEKGNLMKEGFISSHTSGVPSMVVGKAWKQKSKAATLHPQSERRARGKEEEGGFLLVSLGPQFTE